MRVLVYDDQMYRRGPDGALWTERTLPGFACELRHELGQVTLIGRLDPSAEPWNFRLPDDVDLVPLPFYGSLANPLAVAAAALRSLRAYWRALDDADGVWLLGPHPFALLFALLARVRRKPIALGVRQELRRYARTRHPDRRAVHAVADALEWSWRALARRHPVAVVGPELGRQYARSADLLVLYVSLIRAAEVSDPAAEAQRAWDGDVQLLSVGRIDQEKNPLLLADILARLNADGRRWRMVICGAGPMEDALRARLEQLGVADRAELAGYVPAGDELMAIYRRSHAFLHVSFTEGVPQVLFEAFAAALPVVATDVGGVAHATGTDAALLVPPGELEPAVAALERLAADPALRLRLAESGAERVRRHTLEAEIGRLAAFLRKAFERR